MIKSSDYTMMEFNIINNLIPTFRTKKDAQKFASSIGWQQYNVVRVERRFETVWIVAQTHIQPKVIAGINFETYTCPSGEYEFRNGTQQMIVFECKKMLL